MKFFIVSCRIFCIKYPFVCCFFNTYAAKEKYWNFKCKLYYSSYRVLKAEYSFFSLGSLLDNIITAGTTAALPKNQMQYLPLLRYHQFLQKNLQLFLKVYTFSFKNGSIIVKLRYFHGNY